MSISSTDTQFLHDIRQKANDLARLVKEAAGRGYHVNFNINGTIGVCDVFTVHTMTPVLLDDILADLQGKPN